MDLSLSAVERRLAAHNAKSPSRTLTPRRAAVAALLRYESREPEVLLMERASRKGDRWSGQVSFPGGREEPHDTDLLATAVRETHEEVGVDLHTSARLLGRTNAIRAVAKGKVLPMSITPYVFVQTAPIDIVLNREAASAFWFPLGSAARGELDAPYEYRAGPVKLSLDSWRYEEQVVWGLTHRMIRQLLDLLT